MTRPYFLLRIIQKSPYYRHGYVYVTNSVAPIWKKKTAQRNLKNFVARFGYQSISCLFAVLFLSLEKSVKNMKFDVP